MTIEEENIKLVIEAIREKIDQQINNPIIPGNGYARATGYLHGMLEMLVSNVPEAREYISKYFIVATLSRLSARASLLKCSEV
jgi:hypothetical protein